MKLTKARRDQYRKLAKQQGYRSRAAFKLLQLNKSYKIIKNSDKVVEFGCAPGGWIQVATQLVGPSGFVLGLDLKEINPLAGASFIKGSIDDPLLTQILLQTIGPNDKFDVVLSDMSPNVSGIWEIDHERQISLTRHALLVSIRILERRGNAIYKIFQGVSTRSFVNELAEHFALVKLSKPPASRQESSELYVICLGFKG
ncbi:MAG: 23S rRNA (uridine(2552)-2'-O)-methyltransferase [Nitrososphaeraceae archaeon]|nr:23S rRNA (uridine(2552)-2'-O)-methyltransferase [Nitrososphaeraceae archaeon]